MFDWLRGDIAEEEEAVATTDVMVVETLEQAGELVEEHSGEVFTDSRVIAEKFGKRHKDIIRAIRSQSEEFSRRNFGPRDFIDSRGQTQPMYYMTRDGAMMLIMGFTGSEAQAWKENFLKAFNLMEQTLKEEMQKNYTDALIGEYKKVEVLEEVLEYKKDYLYTTTEIAKELGSTSVRLNKLLRLKGVIFRRPGQSHLLKVDYADKGYGVLNTWYNEYGYPQYSMKWTEEGRQFIKSLIPLYVEPEYEAA